jgi:acyl-CoA synthetase (AMP-forming)/AMP-acid ligase II
MDLGELPRRNARRHPHKISLVEGDKRYTFHEFNERINRLGNGLLDLGVSKGDRVAILLSNCSEYAELYFGLAKIGAIIVPLNFRLKPKEYLPYFNTCQCNAIVFGELFTNDIQEIRPSLRAVKHFITVGKSTMGEAITYDDLLSNSPELEPIMEINEQDVAAIFFTSGTTGFPKGAMWTHRNILEQIVNLQIDLPFSRDDIGLILLPMFHGPVTIPLLHQLFYIGGSIIISSSPHFDPRSFLETILNNGVTCTFIVPTMLFQLVNFPEIDFYRDAVKKLRQIKYAAAPASVDVLKRAVQLFGPIFTQGYGLTETIGGVTFLAKEDHTQKDGKDSAELNRRLRSCGREYINTHIKIVGDDGREVPAGKVGEIIVKGDKNFIGYWEMPEETEKVLKGGWLYTGDLGMLDEEGYLYVVDRKKDLIISGGENLYPAEIEEAINRNPKVKESAVIGVPDPLWGESVKAFVVLKEGEKAIPEEIIAHYEKELASYKKPRFVEFLEGLPKNSMGKILKYLLREKGS